MSNYTQAFQHTMPVPSRYGYNFGPSESSNTVPAILVVDSSERDRDRYENPGQYTYNFIKGYTEVVRVQLIKANIPSSGYIVTASNNAITFTYGDEYIINLSVGNYTSTLLAAELQLRMNAALGFDNGGAIGSRFNVEVDAILTALKITAQDSIEFTAGGTNNADIIIGLGNNDVTSSEVGGVSVLTLPNSFNLNPNRYMILCIRGLERCDSNNNATQGAFCVIPFDITTDNFILGQDCDGINGDSYTYYFTEPLPKFTKMEISFLNRDGSIYDFNGKDHFMIFQITSLSRATKR
jgi:hypothetical protein